jgi:release factor H-coupled RctB family protein
MSEPVLDSCHNSVACRAFGRERLWLHRKGAAPSDRGPIVVPGSRGTFAYLVQPIGDHSGNAWSIAHGAGRKWSRSESRQRARERFHPDELVQTGLGGRVICEERDLLHEEAPIAYKHIETVIADLVNAGLISVIATFRPLLTYKTRAVRR